MSFVVRKCPCPRCSDGTNPGPEEPEVQAVWEGAIELMRHLKGLYPDNISRAISVTMTCLAMFHHGASAPQRNLLEQLVREMLVVFYGESNA